MIGSLLGGMIGQQGANTAAGMASGAGNQALAGAMHQQDVNNASSAPWTQTGSKAAQSIAALLGYGGLSNQHNGINGTDEGATLGYGNDYNPEMQAAAANQLKGMYANSGATLPTYHPINVSDTFTADPSYAWRVSEGNKSLDRSAASKGMLLSGAQAKGLTDYNQNAASQEYGNWFNRLNQATASNFGQQQTIYGDQYGQYNDALNRLYAATGMGQQSQSSNNALNSGLTTSGYGANLQGQKAAGDDYQAGANALASGIGKGINNTLAAGYLASGGFGGGGGGSVYDRAKQGFVNTATVGGYNGQSGYTL